jgi:acetylornithine deacetylase/succinyl-diaminopimelate desuccinylase-like protein
VSTSSLPVEPDVVNLLRAMVAVPSVSPGMDASSPGEGALGDWVIEWAKAEGFAAHRQEVHSGRNNVLVDLGPAELPTLALVTHLDTVPLGSLTERARTGALADGRVYGRGACDAKGSLAAMLTALRVLRERRDDLRVNVQVAAMADEEHTFHGVLEYIRRFTPESRPVAAIVGEPTRLEVVRAHKGVLRFRLETIGRAAHSARPGEGINAIDQMTVVLSALRTAFAAEPPIPHPLLGSATFTVTQIEGGIAPNVVPERCAVVVDRRLLPGESGASALAWVDGQLDLLRGADPQLHVERHEPFVVDDALETASEAPLVQAALAARSTLFGPSSAIGVPFGTDGSKLAARAGIPTIVLGPGDIAQAHTADEWIEVEQLVQAVRVYVECALAMGSGGRHAV